MKKLAVSIFLVSFLLGGCAKNMGDQRISAGMGTVHAPCDTCAVYDATFHLEVYPDEYLTHKLADAINNATPAQVLGIAVNQPTSLTETSTGKKRYEVNVSLSVPMTVSADKLAKLPAIIKETTNSYVKSNFNANKAADFEKVE